MLGLLLLFLTAYALLALLGAAATVWAILRPRRRTFGAALALGLPTEPADRGLTGEEARFNLPGGHTSPGWVLDGLVPNGPVVQVLHGHRDSRFGALLRAAHLVHYASHVVVFDWPGHGDCTAPWMTCGGREPADAIAVLDGLPDAVRDKPVVLFGYSLGGQIAVKAAALYPDRYAGVIADGPYRRWDTPVRRKIHRLGLPTWPFMPLVGAFFAITGMTRDFDRAAFAAKLRVPLLVLHGTDDWICPIQEGRELADAAPQGRLVAIEGGTHNHLYDQDPQTYHDAMLAFFENIGVCSGRRDRDTLTV